MIEYLFEPQPHPILKILDNNYFYPVRRIFCVGRNYADHAKEMGAKVDKSAPLYFSKPAYAVVHSGDDIPYPIGTTDLHYEIELVVALRSSISAKASDMPTAVLPDAVLNESILGYCCGIDLTRRDLQLRAKEKGHPWDLAKAFENSAVLSPINTIPKLSDLAHQQIQLKQNGDVKQQARLGDMIFSINDLLNDLNQYYHLGPGDLLFTGTPAGVGAIAKGDELEGKISGVGTINLKIQS